MASPRQTYKVGEYLVNNTDAGKQVSGVAVAGAIGVAKAVGLGAIATAAAPIVVPSIIAAGIGALIMKGTSKKGS